MNENRSSLENIGVPVEALQVFIEEQIYTLPGTDRHRETFSILLTGSRAFGAYTYNSDVDIDVLCPQEIFNKVLKASYDAGLIKTRTTFFSHGKDHDPQRYFGKDKGFPHFTLSPIEQVERQLSAYEDIPLWIWSNARIITDPDNQFEQIINSFETYPRDVLIKKIKYHWLMWEYAAIDIFPHHSEKPQDLLAALTSVVGAVNELLKLCFLVEGKPFPYTEKLMSFSRETKLGKEICPLMQRIIDLTLGVESPELSHIKRMQKALDLILCEDVTPEAKRLGEVCAKALLEAGVEPEWVEADFNNIDQLLAGHLGPPP